MSYTKGNRKFGRETNQRRALLRSLAIALINEEKIKTTESKAKEIRPMVEKIITKGKSDSLATRRMLISRLGSEEATEKIIKVISPRYKERNGGYTRITKIGRRISDASPMAYIQFV